MNFPDLTRGLCREVGLEIFFPEREDNFRESYRAARLICSGCVVKQECLQWAIHHEDHGMWGGTTPKDRREIRKRKNIILREVYVREFV